MTDGRKVAIAVVISVLVVLTLVVAVLFGAGLAFFIYVSSGG